jgi:L-lactate permease
MLETMPRPVITARFSPFLGWLGVFLTGSDTSSNALFAALQATAAQQIGVSDILLVAANTTGGVTGKMISPQSIAIACAAVGLVGKESGGAAYIPNFTSTPSHFDYP